MFTLQIATASSAPFAQDILRPSPSHFSFFIHNLKSMKPKLAGFSFELFPFFFRLIFMSKLFTALEFSSTTPSEITRKISILSTKRAKIHRPKNLYRLNLKFEILVKKWRPSSCKNRAGANESS